LVKAEYRKGLIQGDVLPLINGEIMLVKSDFTAQPPRSFNAQQLIQALEPYVKGGKCSRGNVCPHAKPYLQSN